MVSPCPTDLDDDFAIGLSDLVALLAAWGPCDPKEPECPADLDADGQVGFGDLVGLLADWGPCAFDAVHLWAAADGTVPTCWATQDDGCTDGSFPMGAYASTFESVYTLTGIPISITAPTAIVDIAVVGGNAFTPWADYDLRIAVHGSLAHFASDPLNGDVISVEQIAIQPSPPVLFGGSSATLGFDNHYVELAFAPFVLPPGDHVMVIAFRSFTEFHISESTVDAGSAWRVTSFMPGQVRSYRADLGYPTGTPAIDVVGWVLPE